MGGGPEGWALGEKAQGQFLWLCGRGNPWGRPCPACPQGTVGSGMSGAWRGGMRCGFGGLAVARGLLGLGFYKMKLSGSYCYNLWMGSSWSGLGVCRCWENASFGLRGAMGHGVLICRQSSSRSVGTYGSGATVCLDPRWPLAEAGHFSPRDLGPPFVLMRGGEAPSHFPSGLPWRTHPPHSCPPPPADPGQFLVAVSLCVGTPRCHLLLGYCWQSLF